MDVPAKLAARVRLFDTGHNRKTDAHSIAIVAVRTEPLRVLQIDGELEALRMLATVRPRDIAGKTRRRITAEGLAEPVAVEAKIKTATRLLR